MRPRSMPLRTMRLLPLRSGASATKGLSKAGAYGRHHDGHAVDRDGLVVGRTRAAAAAFDAGFRINQPHAVGLQFVDQLFRRDLRVHPGCSHEESLHRRGGTVVE